MARMLEDSRFLLRTLLAWNGVLAGGLVSCGADERTESVAPNAADASAPAPGTGAPAAGSDSSIPKKSDGNGQSPGPPDGAPPAPADGGGGSLSCDAARKTCVDKQTGLTWEATQRPTLVTWEEAGKYCATLSLDGGGWRLPNIQELRSVIRGCRYTELTGPCKVRDPECTYRGCMEGCDQCQYPVINGKRFCTWPEEFGGSCDQFSWTSTNYEGSITPGVWYVDFGNGGWVHGIPKGSQGLARCTRGTPKF